MAHGAPPGRREGILFPIVLPLIVIALVATAIVTLGNVLLAAASIEKNIAIAVALAFTLAIMIFATLAYAVGQRGSESDVHEPH